jgi:hypothetical protein
MAKMACACGTILRDDDPDASLFLLSSREFDVELSAVQLLGMARLVLRCPVCERLWIYWKDGERATEYVPSGQVPDGASPG